MPANTPGQRLASRDGTTTISNGCALDLRKTEVARQTKKNQKVFGGVLAARSGGGPSRRVSVRPRKNKVAEMPRGDVGSREGVIGLGETETQRRV